MEIIRRGTPPSERTYLGSCGCGTRVRFKQSEGKLSPDQRDPGYYVTCPICTGSIFGRPEDKSNSLDRY